MSRDQQREKQHVTFNTTPDSENGYRDVQDVTSYNTLRPDSAATISSAGTLGESIITLRPEVVSPTPQLPESAVPIDRIASEPVMQKDLGMPSSETSGHIPPADNAEEDKFLWARRAGFVIVPDNESKSKSFFQTTAAFFKEMARTAGTQYEPPRLDELRRKPNPNDESFKPR